MHALDSSLNLIDYVQNEIDRRFDVIAAGVKIFARSVGCYNNFYFR